MLSSDNLCVRIRGGREKVEGMIVRCDTKWHVCI